MAKQTGIEPICFAQGFLKAKGWLRQPFAFRNPCFPEVGFESTSGKGSRDMQLLELLIYIY